MRFADPPVVTVSLGASEREIEWACSLARELDLVLVPRGERSLEDLAAASGASAVLVVGKDGLSLFHEGRRYVFHPNMAVLRVDRLRKGVGDRLVAVAGLGAGDRVLDCTCGMAADAVVASFVVGEGGEVRALEASPVLASLVRGGLASYVHPDARLCEAMRRVEVLTADYRDYLAQEDPGSWDVVLFDPMFESTYDASRGIDLVRILGREGLPDREDIERARRVARRCVVVKDRPPGALIRRLGVDVVHRSRKVWYGVAEGTASRS
ncbi:protein of unknown function DUF548 [Spirochaeta thermophila DSM 6578]|uniref:SAM-dependent methyltransferase n=1 Tax=Winmispira thermophila (strain ATCC 700085 / DSM 6578 / Z-1203) TaxID=869211 RepID=G0GA16_WINT7|nr:class I SAM-dependent methyltransferase [Spirochaeta thermophila]AEJ61704.1 protein of unknown function DUF548 [Spirochaeta thermophila DSM 6578]